MDNRNVFEQEWQKMLKGKIYEATLPGFQDRLEETRKVLWEYNGLHPSEKMGVRKSYAACWGIAENNVASISPSTVTTAATSMSGTTSLPILT